MDTIAPAADHYFQLLRYLPAAVRADLISRLAASLVANPEAASVNETSEAATYGGRGGWADSTDDFAAELRAARTPNTRPAAEW